MKLINNSDNIIIYISKKYLNLNKNNLEDYFTDIFLKIKQIYAIDLKGYYETKVYIDSNYGIIIDMNKEDVDFDYYYDNQIDMKTTIKEIYFLYKIEDNYYFDIIKNKDIQLYLYKNNIYAKLKNNIDDKIIDTLLEHSFIYYNDDIDLITTHGKLVNP